MRGKKEFPPMSTGTPPHEVKPGNSGERYVQSRVRIRANPKASMALEGTPESEGRTGPWWLRTMQAMPGHL